MKLKTILLTTAGFILIALGAIGLFLPVWPTTPFVLVAAACFTGNPKMKEKIMRIPFVNEHLTNYKNRTGLKKKTVIVNLTFLWVMLIASAVVIKSIWLAIFLFALGTGVTTHIVHMSKPKNS